MCQICMSVYVAILFFILAPGVLLSLPAGGSCVMKAGVHAVVFGLVYCLTNKMVYRMCRHNGMY